MVKTEREHREDIVRIGQLVFQKGWVAANDGNITVRMDAERILATPTGVCKGMMHVDDLIIVDMKGNKISGRAERTSEIAMHRSEEHTSELQSPCNLVCRLLLEKKNN